MSHDKKQQQPQRYARTRRLPLFEEQWPSAAVFHTSKPFCGRYFYSVKEEEPISGLTGLAHTLPIASSGRYRSPLLVPTGKGLAQFGLLAVTPKTIQHQEGRFLPLESLLSARWLFAVEWVNTLSAWNALLFTLDHLDPIIISLKPTQVILTMFVARMAEHPQTSVLQTIRAWAPLLDEIQEHLLPLILALYLFWADGPSLAAQELRAQQEEHDPLDEEQTAIIGLEKGLLREELVALEHIVGAARLQILLHAERLVPAVLLLLVEVSWVFWDTTTHIHEQYCALLKTHPAFWALLPIALWEPEVPSALALPRDGHQHFSRESLYEYWQSRPMTNENHADILINVGNRTTRGLLALRTHLARFSSEQRF